MLSMFCKPKLSVIIPVYNVEKYLGMCINSIMTQTYSDLEIILVDDGSTDNSPQLCEEFSKKDPRIKVINQTNSGVSAARNTGIAAATCDYITFVDSDDWLHRDMYLNMTEILERHPRTDGVMCDFATVKNNTAQQITSQLREGLYTKKDIIREIYPTLLVTEDFSRLPIVSACTCIFKRSFILENNIQFDESLRYSEDYLFMADVMTHCDSYYYLKNFSGYHYRQYEDSRSKKYQPEWWLTLVSLNDKLKKLLAGSEEHDFTRQLKLQLIHSALFVSSSINNQNLGYGEKIKLLNTVFGEPSLKSAFSQLNFSGQSRSLRIVLFLIKHRMPLAYLFYIEAVSMIKK